MARRISTTPRTSIVRKTLLGGAVLAGVSLGAAGVASAATPGSTTTSPNSPNRPGGAPKGAPPTGGAKGAPPRGGLNPATMAHGPGETLLTGTALGKADDAARLAVPGATIIRAETDSSGASMYEVHMKKSDGSYVTVELNSSFQVVKTVAGFGGPPAGARGSAGPGGPGSPGGPPSQGSPGSQGGPPQSKAAA